MDKILNFIKANKLIKRGEIIGVATSGGIDSMCLLHYLATHSEELDISVVAIHVDHSIRAESASDAEFVIEKAKEWGVKTYKFKIDAKKYSETKKLSLETGARDARYEVFKNVLDKGIVDKIALAHHQADQAETILMHIFRGSGTAGAKGMEPIRDGVFIRPMLDISKAEIKEYARVCGIDFVEDKTNADISYNRNFLRNVILPQIETRYPNAIGAICNLAKDIETDDAYIQKQIPQDVLFADKSKVQIDCFYLTNNVAIASRLLFLAFKKIGITKDIERRHIDILIGFAKNAENGKKMKLPFGATAYKEYDHITLQNVEIKRQALDFGFSFADFSVESFGKIVIKRCKQMGNDGLYFDPKKLPKDAIWRYKKDGDVFQKFGGGTKKLKSYFVDKKIPQRLRGQIPVLASGNEIYIIAGVEISDKIKVDTNSTQIANLQVEKQK